MMNRGGAPATPAAHHRTTLLRPSTIIISSRGSRRSSSSSSGPRKETASSSSSSTGTTNSNESTSSHEIVLTPGEKVVATTRLFFSAGALTFASMCAYYIGKELLPTKMSPNTVFDKATAIVRQNTEVTRRFGDSIKTYGRDHGGHREGRRNNFIEHTEQRCNTDIE
jgi:import inner membrane translocase subunit TIM21